MDSLWKQSTEDCIEQEPKTNASAQHSEHIANMKMSESGFVELNDSRIDPSARSQPISQSSDQGRRRNTGKEFPAGANHHALFASSKHDVGPPIFPEEPNPLGTRERDDDMVVLVAWEASRLVSGTISHRFSIAHLGKSQR